jgi:hypothetical protein
MPAARRMRLLTAKAHAVMSCCSLGLHTCTVMFVVFGAMGGGTVMVELVSMSCLMPRGSEAACGCRQCAVGMPALYSTAVTATQ